MNAVGDGIDVMQELVEVVMQPLGEEIADGAKTQLGMLHCGEQAGFAPGITFDTFEQLFDLFARGEQEPAVAGTGLGLAICKSIVAAHGGTIFAENCPDGACVRFTLPLGTPPAVEDEESI